MQLLGFGDRKEVASALDYMREWRPTFDKDKVSVRSPGACPQYYCYYAAQCKYQAGMKPGATPANKTAWQEWNTAMKKLYTQPYNAALKFGLKDDGVIKGVDGKDKKVGYWPWVADETCKGGGNTMTTCLCALQLMVYYRYLPTTKIEAAKPAAKEDDKKKAAKDVDVEVDI